MAGAAAAAAAARAAAAAGAAAGAGARGEETDLRLKTTVVMLLELLVHKVFWEAQPDYHGRALRPRTPNQHTSLIILYELLC